MRSSLEPGALGSSDSPCEPRHLASIPPGPGFPTFLPSEAGTTETPQAGWRPEPGAQEGPLQGSRTGLSLRVTHAGLAAASGHQHVGVFPRLCEETCFFPLCSQEELLRPWLGGLGCLLVPCPRFVPWRPWQCPLRHMSAAPPSPSQGPSWPPTVTLPPALSGWPSYLDPSVGCVLLPPHPTHPPGPQCPLSMASGPWPAKQPQALSPSQQPTGMSSLNPQ